MQELLQIEDSFLIEERGVVVLGGRPMLLTHSTTVSPVSDTLYRVLFRISARTRSLPSLCEAEASCRLVPWGQTGVETHANGRGHRSRDTLAPW
jgi:hypothetical protein